MEMELTEQSVERLVIQCEQGSAVSVAYALYRQFADKGITVFYSGDTVEVWASYITAFVYQWLERCKQVLTVEHTELAQLEPEEQILTTAEIADLLTLSPRTVQRHIKDGNLAARKYGRDFLVEGQELARFKRERRGVGRPKR